MGFEVWGSRFGVQGLGFEVWGSRFGAQGLARYITAHHGAAACVHAHATASTSRV
jgi:hypothetical protein